MRINLSRLLGLLALVLLPLLPAVASAQSALSGVQPNSVREPRQSQTDIRISKVIRMGRARLQPRFDVYNLFNVADVLSLNARTWLLPTDVLSGRLFKIGALIDF